MFAYIFFYMIRTLHKPPFCLEKIYQYLDKTIRSRQSHCRAFFIHPAHRHLLYLESQLVRENNEFKIETKPIYYHATGYFLGRSICEHFESTLRVGIAPETENNTDQPVAALTHNFPILRLMHLDKGAFDFSRSNYYVVSGF